MNCPGQLRAPHGLEVLDASRLPDFPLDAPLSAALEEGLLTAVNTGRAGWEQVLSQRAGTEKKRVNILAIGDVGSTLLTGLKLLGVHSEDAAIIGDRMDTDIVAGIESGLDTVLVLSGVTTIENMLEFPYRPRLILDGVGDIPAAAAAL